MRCFVVLLTAGMAVAIPPRQTASAPGNGRGGSPAPSSHSQASRGPQDAKPANPAKLFQLGQDALTHGQLDEAERNFRAVLQVDPQSGGAYANLGVVYMRRKQWNKALENLQKAEHLHAADRGNPAQHRTRLLPPE